MYFYKIGGNFESGEKMPNNTVESSWKNYAGMLWNLDICSFEREFEILTRVAKETENLYSKFLLYTVVILYFSSLFTTKRLLLRTEKF